MMTVYVPRSQWLACSLWLEQNYLTSSAYTLTVIEDKTAITFRQVRDYTSFYHAWQHIICADNDL